MSLSNRFTFAAMAVLAVGACSTADTVTNPTAPALVVYGSGNHAGASLMDGDSGAVFGPAGSLTIKLYSLYVSANTDCSGPQLVQDLGSAGLDKDFMTNPILFEGSPAAGTYQCVMLKMSDVLNMMPATTFGGCVAGTNYAGDIYRAGDSSWVDVNLNRVAGTGTDSLPADDHVTIFMTRDTAAALARGISANQLVQLQSSLIVPGQTTFRMDASSAVATNGVQCGIEKPVMSFH